MDFQEEIKNLENNVNKLMEILGTRFEADYLEAEIAEKNQIKNSAKNSPNVEQEKVEKIQP